MEPSKRRGTDGRLPLRRGLTPTVILSCLVLILMAAASVAGILGRAAVYPTDDLLQAFLPTDVTILSIGLPMLLASMGLAWRGRLLGLLLWPGALFFVLYNSLAYVLALPTNVVFLLQAALVGLSAYALAILLASIDGRAVTEQLAGRVQERPAGGILAGLGLLFFLRALGILASVALGEASIAASERAVTVTDLLTAPAWVLCGVLLWRRRELGYVTGLGALFQASMLFVGLILFLLIRPLLTTVAFSLVDVVVVFVMGLTCSVPLALYVRGVISRRRAP